MEQSVQSKNRLLGIFLVVISAITFSTAGIFTKGVEAGPWDVMFWRGVFAAGFTLGYVLWQKKFSPEFLKMGKAGWVVAILGASGTAAFIVALKITSMTNVALIYASGPLIAAVLAWVWIGEALSTKLVASCAVAFLGVLVIVWGVGGAASLTGDLLALWMTAVLAVLMVVYRRFPQIPVAGPAAMSSVVLLPFGMMLGQPLSVELVEIAYMSAFGLVFAVASVTLFEGARRLPSGQTALLSGLELPFAVAFGWLFFAEMPVVATFVGGTMIVVGILSSQLRS